MRVSKSRSESVALERTVKVDVCPADEEKKRAAIREEAAMISNVKKRSIVIRNHKTSISLEDMFWACLQQIARERVTTLPKLIGMLHAERNRGNLSSTIRVFVLDHYRNNVSSNQILPANEKGRNLPARQPSAFRAQLIALTKNKCSRR
jgi:predicted DNA-binding ribbon-helix-helix protein